MDEIIVELDSAEIAILKEDGAVNKETDDPELPVLFICKWDIAKEMLDGLDGEAGLINVLYEPDEAINEKRKRFKCTGLIEGE